MQTQLHLSAEQIKSALLTGQEDLNALDELLSTGEAAFNLIEHLEIAPDLKIVFEQLRKQFRVFGNMVVLEGMGTSSKK